MSGRKQQGFGVVEVILILVILGIIAFVGWRVYQANEDARRTDQQTIDTSNNSSTVPEIDSAKDIDGAEKAIDNVDVDGTSSQELDSELTF